MGSKPHGIAVDIWAVGVLVLQLVSGDQPVALPENLSTENEIEDLVVSANLQRIGKKSAPISQNGVNFILSCLNLRPSARPTASGAAKHAWLRESTEEVLLFKEREKQLYWKPRDLVIPAIVRLSDVAQDSDAGHDTERELSGEIRASTSGCGVGHGQAGSSQVIPDSLQNSQSTAFAKKPHSTMHVQSTVVV